MNHFVMRLNGYYWNDNIGWVTCMDQASLYNMKPSITYSDTKWVQSLYISGKGNVFTKDDLIEAIRISGIYADLRNRFSQDILKEVLLQYLQHLLTWQEPQKILDEAYNIPETELILRWCEHHQNMRTNKFASLV